VTDAHAGDPHSYGLAWDPGVGAAVVRGDYVVLAGTHAHRFGMRRSFAAGAGPLTLNLRYRAQSGTPGSSVTNLQYAIWTDRGLVQTGPLVAGGVWDTGWVQAPTLTLELAEPSAVFVEFMLEDAWENDWRQEFWVDDISLTFTEPVGLRFEPLPGPARPGARLGIRTTVTNHSTTPLAGGEVLLSTLGLQLAERSVLSLPSPFEAGASYETTLVAEVMASPGDLGALDGVVFDGSGRQVSERASVPVEVVPPTLAVGCGCDLSQPALRGLAWVYLLAAWRVGRRSSRARLRAVVQR
jgi:hypothetical protein